MTITAALNVYQEAIALPSALEAAKAWADDILVIHSSPYGKFSTDGTMEILKESGVRYYCMDVMIGFGRIRTQLIQRSKTDWVMILDADERFHPITPVFSCHGQEQWPVVAEPNLTLTKVQDNFNQLDLLRHLLQEAPQDILSLQMSRRHWMCAPGEWECPCQSWNERESDWQQRCVRVSPWVFYDPERAMHEIIKDTRTWSGPKYISGDTLHGPFFDHYSQHFKKLGGQARIKEAIATYESLDHAGTQGMWVKQYEEKEIKA